LQSLKKTSQKTGSVTSNRRRTSWSQWAGTFGQPFNPLYQR